MKDHIFLNCGERYELMIDHRSYTRNLSSYDLKLKPEKISGFFSRVIQERFTA